MNKRFFFAARFFEICPLTILFYRACPIPNACPGSSIQQAFCNEQTCTGALAVGQWSGWSAWGQCSQSCGVGIKRRTRHCQGGNCPGNLQESFVCNFGTCGTTTANWGGEQDSTTSTITTTVENIGTGNTNQISTVSVIGIESTTTTTTTTILQPSTTTTTTTTTIKPSTTQPAMEWRLLPGDSSQDAVLRWTLIPISKDEAISPNQLEMKTNSDRNLRFQYTNGKGLSSARSVSQNEARRLRLRF